MRTPSPRAPSPRRQKLDRSIAQHILVATEGSESITPEIRVARALADRFGSKIDVVSVVTPVVPAPLISDVGLIGSMNPIAPPPPDLAGRRHRIGNQLALAGRPTWNVTVVAGWPAEKIAEVASEVGATLIVMGIGRHAPLDRLMGSETVLQVVHETDIPVLAVSRDLTGVPRHALAAVDFTVQSEVAADAAARLMADDGILFLAHVRTDWSEMPDPQLPVDLYAAGVEKRFDQLERRLTVERAAPRSVERIVRHGDPARELLQFAETSDIDLIAVGARTHSRLYRIFLGSVAAKLLRSAHCSVLVIPANAERMREAVVLGTAERGKARPHRKARTVKP